MSLMKFMMHNVIGKLVLGLNFKHSLIQMLFSETSVIGVSGIVLAYDFALNVVSI